MESKGTRIAKTNLKKKNKVGGINLPDFKTILYSYGNQYYVVLVEWQTHRSTKQNRELRNRITQMCPTGF